MRTKQQLKADEWLIKNLAYCEDTHSFTHRLMGKLGLKIDKNIYQTKAMEVLNEMGKEYDTRTIDKEEE